MAERPGPDLVDLLISQHEQVRDLFRQLAAAPDTDRERLLRRLVRVIAWHESIEEVIVHPIVLGRVMYAEHLVARREQEEHQAKHDISALYLLGVDHPDFSQRCAQLAADLQRHLLHEETEEFPALRLGSSPAELHRLATVVTQTWTAMDAAIGSEDGDPPLPEPAPIALFDRARTAARRWYQLQELT
ncbi:hemerythrin domain-containing protein [Solwaraspora sp. WMMB335]|uniref:hemerythrin domain-containing protein n=1 Tax=Solwaraspora sp. WMMB335 TaxID=3404118 RepID=UPI003B946EC7